MALPKLETSIHEVILPSTGKKIKFRPWLVKEQKILLMAQESEDPKQIESAFANIVSECTFKKIDPYNNPLFDVEYIFLQLRKHAVGSKVNILVTCPDDETTKTSVEIDLNDVEIQMKKEHTNVVQLTDDITLYMKYPTLADASGFDSAGQVQVIFEMLKKCIDRIEDGEDVYQKIDITDEELDEFIGSMPQEYFDKVGAFFDTMPKLQHIVKVTNPKTKKKSEVVVEGLQSFFV